MDNNKKVIESLKIIQNICKDNLEINDDCTICPFFVDETEKCGIVDTTPDNWKILKYTKFQALA